MKVYIVVTENNEDVNFDDDSFCLIRSIYGVYSSESAADVAMNEAALHHDYAFIEAHEVV